MLKRNRIKDDRANRVQRAPRARGGVSLGAVLTGVVVAFGALFLLSALIGGVLAATGVAAEDISRNDVVDAGIAGGIAFVVAQFLSYLWGGYTAGRMARGAGALNGFLVPLVAIVIAAIVAGVVAALGASAQLNLPFGNARLPLQEDYQVDWGLGLGIAAIVSIFLGGILGGILGARWHTKLERRAEEEVDGRHLREDRTEATREETAGRTSTEPRTTDQTDDADASRQPRR
jgi:hypothetical protein